MNHGVTKAKNIQPTEDVEIEFVKACPSSLAVPKPHFAQGPMTHKNQFVIIDHSIADGQMQSIADAFGRDIKIGMIKQIYLVNNLLSGDKFAQLLSTVDSNHVKSIIYGGNNTLTK